MRRFWKNRLRVWPAAKGSFFVVVQNGAPSPPPVETFYILTEDNFKILAENGDNLIQE
jgi:hypothetical protein